MPGRRSARRAAAVLALIALLALPAGAGRKARPLVLVHRLDGMIHGVSARILHRALAEADERGAALFLLELDTPGGLVDAAEDMVRDILNSPVPVAVYVAPRGAHAASAGFFLLLAADVAAMAPVTRTGAAHPITVGGENREGDIALQKASEDLAALLRSAARARGRPAALAEQAVRESRSWSAEEARDAGLVDMIAGDRGELLRRLDGREVVRSDGTRITLHLADPRVESFRLRWQESFQNVILHPVVLSLLLSLGVLALYIEFTHPGLVLPGVVGAACLLVALYGMRLLPVDWLGAALLALGVLMLVLEIKVVSYGMLTVGGIASLLVGLWLLFPRDVPGLALPWQVLAPLGVLLAVVILPVMWLVLRAQLRRATTGREGMVGLAGEATTALDPEGTVLVHGEYWRARATRPLPAGARVRVREVVDGLRLVVEPEPDGDNGTRG